MSSKNSTEFHDRRSISPQYAPMADEIDLLDVWQILVRQKLLIFAITVLCTACAVGVALWLPRVYKAKLVILPALGQTVEKLNVPNLTEEAEKDSYFFEVDRRDLYRELIDNIRSSRLQRKFYDENKLGELLRENEDLRSDDVVFNNEFRGKLTVKGIAKKVRNSSFVTISLEGSEPEQIAKWLNKFVQLAGEQTVISQTQSFVTRAKRMKASVTEKISSLRSVEKSRRLDRIARLEEAVAVATKLGWVEQANNLGLQYEQAKKDTINMSFSLQDVPLYLRGTKVLQAEIDILSQRKNDDPFIPDLRGLQEQENFLSSVKQDVENVHAMRIDRDAIADDRPIKPQRKLIVVLGLVLGVLLSVFTAFVRNMAVKES